MPSEKDRGHQIITIPVQWSTLSLVHTCFTFVTHQLQPIEDSCCHLSFKMLASRMTQTRPAAAPASRGAIAYSPYPIVYCTSLSRLTAFSLMDILRQVG